jgi:hypothetical protein
MVTMVWDMATSCESCPSLSRITSLPKVSAIGAMEASAAGCRGSCLQQQLSMLQVWMWYVV